MCLPLTAWYYEISVEYCTLITFGWSWSCHHHVMLLLSLLPSCHSLPRHSLHSSIRVPQPRVQSTSHYCRLVTTSHYCRLVTTEGLSAALSMWSTHVNIVSSPPPFRASPPSTRTTELVDQSRKINHSRLWIIVWLHCTYMYIMTHCMIALYIHVHTCIVHTWMTPCVYIKWYTKRYASQESR